MGYKYNIVYKTTNLMNNKIYIGVHSTNDIHDNYIGTGKLIKLAIKKYGRNNFKKDILFIFNNPDEAYEKEMELVNEAFIESKDTYNLRIGGMGGRENTEEFKEYLRQLHRDGHFSHIYKRGKDHHLYGKPRSKEFKQKLSKERMGENNPMYGIKGKNHHCYGKSISQEHGKNISYGLLGEDEVKARLNDIDSSEKNRGWMARLSRKWGVTNRTGLMFIKRWYPEYQKMIKRPKKFCKCGKQISNKSDQCMKCYAITLRNPILTNMSDGDFRDFIWSNSAYKIYKEYKTGKRTLIKMAKERGIEMPPPNYWIK